MYTKNKAIKFRYIVHLMTKYTPGGLLGYIYIMQREDGLYKIGKAMDCLRRKEDHSKIYDQSMCIIKVFIVSDMSNAERLALALTTDWIYNEGREGSELRKMNEDELTYFLRKFEAMIKQLETI